MRWWKILGLAAFVGVAATGVVIAQQERLRRNYTPDEIRARLHARLTEAQPEPAPDLKPPATRRRAWRRPRHRGNSRA